MQSITAAQLNEMLNRGENLQLIDVREPHEHEAFNIGGELIPLGDIITQPGKINTDKPVLVYCSKGIRSQVAIQRLQDKFHFTNLINLTGGTEAWRKQFGV